MSKEQPLALKLADELEMWTLGEPAAAELRRLHEALDWQYTMAGKRLRRIEKLEAENEALRSALTELVKVCEMHDRSISDLLGKPVGWKDAYLDQARAALAQGASR